ncbi:MAG: glycosyltransferase family 4 protein [Chitinophagales bacterium]|nr:glycosyltransferase family 4 protein [Bacteroidota bacterium]MCB9074619.1 glycosyltransferase family 4 protein [Chitinophagales bacterium]
MIKLLYILSHIDKANEFEWLIERLDDSKFQLAFISIHSKEDTALNKFCKQHKIQFHHIQYESKKDVPKSIFKVYQLIKKIKPNIVHAQLFEAGLIGISAAWLAGIKYRIYTRHYSNYHHKFAPSGIKYDKWINSKSTHIISITKMVSDILIQKENVSPEKITLIYHGFPFDNFNNISEERIKMVKQNHYIPEHKKIIGVISRYTFWKGIQDIIPAFRKLLAENADLHLVLANAHGDYKNEIHQLLNELPKDAYTEILFEQDNAALFKCFDVFVHAPIDTESEAFGQIYIEALLVGIPSVFTLSGIANEIIRDKENALVVPHQNSEAIYEAMKLLLKDEQLCSKIKQTGLQTAQQFSIENKINALENLYFTL